MGRADLIGNGKKHLVPSYQPAVKTAARAEAPAATPKRGTVLTRHSGLPPRTGAAPRRKPR